WLQQRRSRRDFFAFVGANRDHSLLGAGDRIVAGVSFEVDDFSNGGEARGVDAHLVAWRNYRAAVDSVVVGDGVFLLEARHAPIFQHGGRQTMVPAVTEVLIAWAADGTVIAASAPVV